MGRWIREELIPFLGAWYLLALLCMLIVEVAVQLPFRRKGVYQPHVPPGLGAPNPPPRKK